VDGDYSQDGLYSLVHAVYVHHRLDSQLEAY
jgi:hypothetical protein